MGVNKQYKDSLFTKLFSEENILRELYYAIKGSDYDGCSTIGIHTLSDVFFLDRKNDISFTVDNKLVVLIEHQAAINENMPLRMLLYCARVYERIITRRSTYKQKQVKIPRPEFIILYNGVANLPDKSLLKLSDAFEILEDTDKNVLELTVMVLNINHGHNKAVMQKSKTLADYVAFIAKVREYQRTLGKEQRLLEKAIKAATYYCINHDILRGFLQENSSEVINMVMTEFNLEEALEVAREEAREETIEEERLAVLALINQGYTLEQLKEKLTPSRISQ